MNSHTSLNSNQRLDMTKLNEETKSKSKIVKSRPPAQAVSQVVNEEKVLAGN